LLNAKEIEEKEEIDDGTQMAKDFLLRVIPTSQDIIQKHQSSLFFLNFNRIFDQIGVRRSKEIIKILGINSGLIADLNLKKFKSEVCTLTSAGAIKKRIRELTKSKILSRDENQTKQKRKNPNQGIRFVQRKWNQYDYIKQKDLLMSGGKSPKYLISKRKVGRPMKRKNLNKMKKLSNVTAVAPVASGEYITIKDLKDNTHERGDLRGNGI